MPRFRDHVALASGFAALVAATTYAATRPGIEHGVAGRVAAASLLICLLAPATRLWPGTRLACIAYVLGHAVGVFAAHAWVIGVLVETAGFSRWTAIAVALGIAHGWAAGRLAILAAIRHRCPGSTVVGPCGLAVIDAALIRLFPFLEPLGLPALVMDLPGAASAFGCFGLYPTAALYAVAAAGLVGARWATAAAAAALACPAAFSAARTVAGGEVIEVAVIQPGPLPSARDRRVARLLALERAAPAAELYIWPEAVIEADDAADLSAAIAGPPERRARVFGVSFGVSVRAHNGVVVVDPAGSRVRWKEHLAPGESRRITAGVAQPAVLPVLGLQAWLPICYELLGPTSDTVAGAQLVVSVASDEFDPTGAASRVMTRVLRLRALELGVPAIRVSSRIASAIVDAHGRVTQLAGAGPQVLRAAIFNGARPE